MIEVRPDQVSTSICGNTYRKITNGSSASIKPQLRHGFSRALKSIEYAGVGVIQGGARLRQRDLIAAHNVPSALFSVSSFTFAASASD
jgi:hypothetical protein